MDDNKKKSTSGKKQNELVLSIVQEAKEHGYISDFCFNYYVGEPGYKLKKQFYCPCKIIFSNGDAWLLYTTTSYRSDRAKEWHWDASNIKRIEGSKKALLIYSASTSEKEKKGFEKAKYHFKMKDGLYAIDDVFSETEFENEIQKIGLANENSGFAKHQTGIDFEKKVVTVLNNRENLMKYQNGNSDDAAILRGRSFDLFKDILSKTVGDCKKLISNIQATCDSKIIGTLPTRGRPKTDVLVRMIYEDNSLGKITISCKQTKKDKVSVHQYTADAFADTLDPENTVLRSLLNKFQANPSLDAFGKENGELLTKELSPYIEKLVLWVLSGKYGSGNVDQIADYLLIYDNDSYVIHSVEEYAKIIMGPEYTYHFGTPFAWTYASKRRGQSIQLKCPIVK